MSGLLLAMSYHAMAQVEVAPVAGHQPTTQEQAVQNQGRSTPVMLSDRIHQIASNLENTSAVHQYNFTAVRGQNVLITTPDTDYDQKWRLEYQVDGGEWQPKRHSSAERIEGLNPGSQVNIRIVATDGARFETADYSVVFGSFPHMRYDLHHEEGFRLIPYGFTKPAFLATQASQRRCWRLRLQTARLFRWRVVCLISSSILSIIRITGDTSRTVRGK